MPSPKLIRFDELSSIKDRECGRKIVLCHGVFDVLHAGHLAYFRAARAFGDVLVVTISTDAHVNKGPGRPYFTDKVRAEMVAALECVDYVAISDYSSAVAALKLLKPDFYVKGQDYKDPSKDVTGGIVEERTAVESGGGKLVFTDEVVHSSSELLNRFFLDRTPDQQATISIIRGLGGIEKIEELLEAVSKLQVTVVGETIIDTYRFVQPENISSKSPSISARFINEENYLGGAYAIARHLTDFCLGVTLVTLDQSGPEPELIGADDRINLATVFNALYTVPRKIRYITHDKAQRMFEVCEIDDGIWRKCSPKTFVSQMLEECNRADVAILADFGHGIFEDEVLEASSSIYPFVAANVQTNSSNFGFNPFTRHSGIDYLALDTREARVAFHDRRASPLALGRKSRLSLNACGTSVGLTLGANGSYYFPKGEGEIFSPAFAAEVVDATGAGDAFFAITAALVKVSAPPEFIPFIGNVYAGLKTKIIGNKSSPTKAQLLKALRALLK